jgi:hypothetical protein
MIVGRPGMLKSPAMQDGLLAGLFFVDFVQFYPGRVILQRRIVSLACFGLQAAQGL